MGNSQDNRHQDTQAAEGNVPLRLADGEFYRALATPQRRRLIYYLLAEKQTTVEELATVLNGWEATTAGTMYTPADRSKLRLDLLHNHLPRLAQAGLIDYDPSDESVQLVSLHPRVTDIIRQSVEAEHRTES